MLPTQILKAFWVKMLSIVYFQVQINMICVETIIEKRFVMSNMICIYLSIFYFCPCLCLCLVDEVGVGANCWEWTEGRHCLTWPSCLRRPWTGASKHQETFLKTKSPNFEKKKLFTWAIIKEKIFKNLEEKNIMALSSACESRRWAEFEPLIWLVLSNNALNTKITKTSYCRW